VENLLVYLLDFLEVDLQVGYFLFHQQYHLHHQIHLDHL
tara:strand:- start:337 stop:453 length:117 start_codon:yes stop_codon:yes gene_type:complete